MPAKTYGTVSPEQQNAMSGLEFVTGLASGALLLNTLAQTLGYDVVEAESGRVAITLQPTDAHLNPSGTVHGGVTAALLDSCMGLAIRSMVERGSAAQRLNSRFRWSDPSRQRPGRSGPKAKSSTAAVVSEQQKDASPTPRADCSRTARRPASSSPISRIAGWAKRSVPTDFPAANSPREFTRVHAALAALSTLCPGDFEVA